MVVMIKNKDILEQGQHHCSLGLALFVWNLERRGIQNNIQFKSKFNIQTSKRPEDAMVQLMMKMLTNDKWNEKDKKQKHDKLKIENKEKNLFVSVAIRYFFVNLFFLKLLLSIHKKKHLICCFFTLTFTWEYIYHYQFLLKSPNDTKMSINPIWWWQTSDGTHCSVWDLCT